MGDQPDQPAQADLREAEQRDRRTAAICKLAWSQAQTEPTFEAAASRYALLLAETVYRTLRNHPDTGTGTGSDAS